jgi:hypothetical protein
VTDSETLVAVLAARLRDGKPHVYMSTACLHTRHEDCRKTCKFCGAACVCACHLPIEPGGAA